MLHPTKTREGDIYEVFARFRPEEPLRNIGTVVASDESLARMYALTLYNEWNWSRMIVVPREKIIPVVEPR